MILGKIYFFNFLGILAKERAFSDILNVVENINFGTGMDLSFGTSNFPRPNFL